MSRTFSVATIQMACASDTAIVIGSQTYNTVSYTHLTLPTTPYV